MTKIYYRTTAILLISVIFFETGLAHAESKFPRYNLSPQRLAEFIRSPLGLSWKSSGWKSMRDAVDTKMKSIMSPEAKSNFWAQEGSAIIQSILTVTAIESAMNHSDFGKGTVRTPSEKENTSTLLRIINTLDSGSFTFGHVGMRGVHWFYRGLLAVLRSPSVFSQFSGLSYIFTKNLISFGGFSFFASMWNYGCLLLDNVDEFERAQHLWSHIFTLNEPDRNLAGKVFSKIFEFLVINPQLRGEFFYFVMRNVLMSGYFDSFMASVIAVEKLIELAVAELPAELTIGLSRNPFAGAMILALAVKLDQNIPDWIKTRLTAGQKEVYHAYLKIMEKLDLSSFEWCTKKGNETAARAYSGASFGWERCITNKDGTPFAMSDALKKRRENREQSVRVMMELFSFFNGLLHDYEETNEKAQFLIETIDKNLAEKNTWIENLSKTLHSWPELIRPDWSGYFGGAKVWELMDKREELAEQKSDTTENLRWVYENLQNLTYQIKTYYSNERAQYGYLIEKIKAQRSKAIQEHDQDYPQIATTYIELLEDDSIIMEYLENYLAEFIKKWESYYYTYKNLVDTGDPHAWIKMSSDHGDITGQAGVLVSVARLYDLVLPATDPKTKKPLITRFDEVHIVMTMLGQDMLNNSTPQGHE